MKFCNYVWRWNQPRVYVMLFVLWVCALATLCVREREGLYMRALKRVEKAHKKMWAKEEDKNVTLKTKKVQLVWSSFPFFIPFSYIAHSQSNLNCLGIIIAECALSSTKKTLRTTKFTCSLVFSSHSLNKSLECLIACACVHFVTFNSRSPHRNLMSISKVIIF